ncbi:MAG: hypothetical protein AB1411_02595 [Nitrospirota bacterium]
MHVVSFLPTKNGLAALVAPDGTHASWDAIPSATCLVAPDGIRLVWGDQYLLLPAAAVDRLLDVEDDPTLVIYEMDWQNVIHEMVASVVFHRDILMGINGLSRFEKLGVKEASANLEPEPQGTGRDENLSRDVGSDGQSSSSYS